MLRFANAVSPGNRRNWPNLQEPGGQTCRFSLVPGEPKVLHEQVEPADSLLFPGNPGPPRRERARKEERERERKREIER